MHLNQQNDIFIQHIDTIMLRVGMWESESFKRITDILSSAFLGV